MQKTLQFCLRRLFDQISGLFVQVNAISFLANKGENL
jgi:hypothetical protein